MREATSSGHGEQWESAELLAALEEFLGETWPTREPWEATLATLTSEARQLTERLVESLAAGSERDPLSVDRVPAMIAEALGADFFDVFGNEGPPHLPVVGEEPATRARSDLVVSLLRGALEAGSRAEAQEVLSRLESSVGSVPGLSPAMTGWFYVLSPMLFPPLPETVVRGTVECLAGSGGLVDAARRLWILTDDHPGQLAGADLAVPAAFVAFAAQHGEGSSAERLKADYGLKQFVFETFLAEEFVERLEREIRANGLMLFSGPRGTGKTHTALRFVRLLCRERGSWFALRAHPGLGYAQLVGSAAEPGLLVRAASLAMADPEGIYPVLIDDLHHMDPRLAFGELTMAFEFPGQPITLPEGRRFVFPPNLLLLGTAQLGLSDLLRVDYTFYRRFAHASFAPDPNKLGEWLKRRDDPVKRIDLVRAFRNLNQLLNERLAGRVEVGHGYLMVDGLSDDNVNALWDRYVLPYIRSRVGDRSADMEVYRLARLV